MYNFGNSALATATKNPNQDNRDAVDKSPPPKANGVAIATFVVEVVDVAAKVAAGAQTRDKPLSCSLPSRQPTT